MLRVVRLLLGVAFCIVGLVATSAGLFGHIDSPAYARAWFRWHENPTSENEAAWIRERDRVAREEYAIAIVGVGIAGMGTWLLRKRNAPFGDPLKGTTEAA